MSIGGGGGGGGPLARMGGGGGGGGAPITDDGADERCVPEDLFGRTGGVGGRVFVT